ncbi:MAG: hypothetical protein M1835_007195, partial [Candelina submexicana]
MATITPIRAPVWPPKPDLSNEVEWGPLPTRDEYTQAYRCWQCPNDTMRVPEPENPPLPEPEGADIVRLQERKTMEILAYNVYKSLEPALLEPHTEPIDIQKPQGADGWRFPSINDEIPESNKDLDKTELEDHNILQDKKYWTIPRIQAYLESQGRGELIPKKPYHTAQQRREILQEYVNSGPSAKISTPGLYPRSNLGSWGLPRENQFVIPPSQDQTRLYSAFELYTWAIHLSPYNPTYWLSRAHLFYQLCHFDLALGDAYRAWYLIEMLVNATERNKQPGLYPRIWDAIARHIEYGGEVYREAGQKMRKENGINYFVPHVRRTIHHIISLSLFALRAWEDFEEMDKHLPARLVQVDEYKAVFDRRRDYWKRYVAHAKQERENKQGTHEELWEHEERMGSIYPRPYPQAGPAIDRTDEGFLRRLNEMLFDENESPLIIAEGQGGGLRVIATEPIAEDQIIFVEEPSARSHLR